MKMSWCIRNIAACFSKLSSMFNMAFHRGFAFYIRIKDEELHEEKQEIRRMFKRKGVRTKDRDEHLRKDLLTRKLLESVITPRELKDVKVVAPWKRSDMTITQLEELDRRLEKAGKIKGLLTDVNEGKKDSFIVNLTILILNCTSKESLALNHLRKTRNRSGIRRMEK